MSASTDKRVIACNVVVGTSSVRRGAKAYVAVVPGPCDRALVKVRSIHGRWIQRWFALKVLADFRVVTVPLESPEYKYVIDFGHDAEDESHRFAVAAYRAKETK